MSRNKSQGWKETVKTVFYAVLIAVVIRTFGYEPFSIPSSSMVPTLLVGDYLFVSKFSYGYSRYSLPLGVPLVPGRVLYSEPERGDVVVFKLPSDNKTDYIKRIVGLPGDRIQVRDGVLAINGEPVKRERVADEVQYMPSGNVIRIPRFIETLPNGKRHYILESQGDFGPADNTDVYIVPDGHFFAMGDNRDNSQDSRYPQVGFVPKKNLVGRAEFLFFSVNGSVWEIWKWPKSLRFDRLFQGIE